jgi:CMP-N,N'-diacetyllegionaminic acid synthase|tara:strand:+ start:33972 stop:34679 length:708 start_codon:yes stop_codon:yes gene_type:complete
MRTIAIIPARGNSKGIHRKNMAELGGWPLLHHTLEAASGCVALDRVLVTSEDGAILKCVDDYNAKSGSNIYTHHRPYHLSQDEVHAVHPVLESYRHHAVSEDEYNAVVMLLPTSPFRTSRQIADAIKLFAADPARSVIGTTKVCPKNSLRYMRDDGTLTSLGVGANWNDQRQDVDAVYRVNGAMFISNPTRLADLRSFHHDNAKAFLMDQISSMDINTQDDLALAELIVRYLPHV